MTSGGVLSRIVCFFVGHGMRPVYGTFAYFSWGTRFAERYWRCLFQRWRTIRIDGGAF